MSLNEKVRDWLKETTNKVIVSLITFGILAALGLVYSNMNVYAAMVRDIIFVYWREILLALLSAALVWLYVKIVEFEKKAQGNSTNMPDSFAEEMKRQAVAMQASIAKQESTLSMLKASMASIGDEVSDLTRDHLYRKARKHEQLNQRGALLCRLRVVELDTKDGNNYHLEESLEELYSYVKKGEHFETLDLSDAKNALTPIKNDGHKVIVEEILAQIKSKLI